MINKKHRLTQRFQNRVKKLSRWRSLILLVLLFLLSIAVPLAVAPISLSTSILQSQQDPSQLVEQAKRLYQTGQFEEAAAVWQQASDNFAAQGDSLNQAIALSNLALSYQSWGRWDEAQQTLATSFHLLRHQPETPQQQQILASTLEINGKLQLAIGQSTRALEAWRQATEIYQKVNNSEGVSRSQINQAQALQALGLYPRACTLLLQTLGRDRNNCSLSPSDLQTLTNPQSVSLQIRALQSLGHVLRILGKRDESQEVLIKSWQLAQSSGNEQTLGEIYLSLGNTVRALGNHQTDTKRSQPSSFSLSQNCIPSEMSHENPTAKINFTQQAESCYRRAVASSLPEIQIQALLNLLNLAVETQQWQNTSTLLPQIEAKVSELNPSHRTVNAQLNYVQLLTCLRVAFDPSSSKLRSPIEQRCPPLTAPFPKKGSSFTIPTWSTIAQIAESAYQQAQALGDGKTQAYALGYLASTYQHQEDWRQAQQLTEQALQIASALNAPDVSYLWQWQLGQLYQIQGDVQNAIAAYTLAVDNLQSLRQDLVASDRDRQFSFRESVEPVYRELVNLLLQENNPSQANLQKARNVLESLQIAELNNYFREACLETQPQAIDNRDPQAGIFYSIVLPDRLAVILSLPGQPLQYYWTSVAAANVERTFDELFANLNPFISNPNPLRPYQQFYDWLIRPAQAQLQEQNITTLVFILDGVLRGVPMPALHDGQQYLIEQYNLALTPGLQLLNPSPRFSQKHDTLAGGLVQARQGFSSLPGVQQELEKISAIVPTEMLLDGNFTRDRLKSSLKASSFSIVHLATHGQFSSQAENTFLLTWDERINVQDLDQVLEKPDPIDLLILSACQTAVGDKRATLGLAGVAVRSRSRSTLATLWSVQDESTADLMAAFYRSFNQPGVTKAEALRQAQLSLLKDPQFQHPYYWAAFVLVGNWL